MEKSGQSFVTERKRAEEALANERNTLRTLIDNLPDNIFIKDVESRFVISNLAHAHLLRAKTPDEIVGKTDFDIFPPELAASYYADEQAVIRSGQPLLNREERTIDPDGKTQWLLTTKVPLRDDHGKVIGLAGINRNITEHKKMEEALRESEAKYSALVEQAKDIVVILQDGVCKFANRAAKEVTGFAVEEIVGKPFMNWLAPESRDLVAQRYKSRMAGEKVPSLYEAKIQCKDGAIKDIEVSAGVIQYEGRPADIAIARDASERKRAEEEARKLTQFLNLVVDSANVWLDVLDEKANVVIWNKAAEKISGYSREEVVGQGKIWEWLYPEEKYRKEVTERAALIIKGRATDEEDETTIRTKSGEQKIISWYSRNLADEKGNVIGSVALGRDISERKRMEGELRRYSEHLEELVEERARELRATKDRLQFLLSSSPAMIYTSKPYGDLGSTFISDNFRDVLGYEPRELLENPSFWIDHVHPKDRRRMHEEELRVIRDGHGSYEYRFQHKDGTFRWMREEARLIRDAAGNPLEVIGYWIDVTDRKQMEEEIKELNESISQRLLQKMSQIENISEVKGRLRKIPDLSTGLDLILDTALGDLDMDVGAVLIVDRKDNTVKTQTFKSKKEGIEIDESYPLDKGFAEIEAVKRNEKLSRIVGQGEQSILKTTSIHCAPIYFGKEIYGILAFGSQKELVLDNSDLAILGLYSELASTLFETQSLTITPVKEVARVAKRRFELEFGYSYLIKNDVEKAFQVFADHVLSGLEGVCITREFPPNVRRKYGLEKTPIVWLAEEREEGQTTVDSLQDLSILIQRFLENAKRRVVLLDGFEYLITRTGFESFIGFLQLNKSRFEKSESILIAPILEEALDLREAKLIEREMKRLTAE